MGHMAWLIIRCIKYCPITLFYSPKKMIDCSSQMRLSLPLEPCRWFHYTHCSTPTPLNLRYYYSQSHSRCNGMNNTGSRRRRCCRHVKASHQQQGDQDNFQLLTAMDSEYNKIVILDTPKSRLLLLDSTHNVHSMLNKERKWTGSYWDEFASLPPVVPDGPIAIFGLGGGTAAHLLLDLWPSLQLEGWEIDKLLIDVSREYLGLSDLEKQTDQGGILNVRIGDVFLPDATIHGGYAGILVDLFAEGKVLPQLEEPATWLELSKRLMPNGRFMVNCGASQYRLATTGYGPPIDEYWKSNSTIRALSEAFHGQVIWKKMARSAGENYLALTGSMPDLSTWSSTLPIELQSSVHEWKPCGC